MTDAPITAVCYLSSAVRKLREDEIEQLLAQSRARNAAAGVTGVLLYCDGNFMQYLEGPAAGVEPIWASIQRDPRHDGIIELLHQSDCGYHLFGGWSMAYRYDHAETLAAQLGELRQAGLVPDATRRTELLARMLTNFRKLGWQ